eukprot:Phypoly_transcript_03722.p1 GENE.Phypoly_transcript_03722~~Phypoly_transcript_03722.p1  ORF type:complete len:772 (+),score=58.98 Phypoly_transcript_03722:345-2318(+)
MAAFQCAVVEHCIGVVGAAYSQYSELVQYVLQNYSIPQISPVSTTSELSDKTQYPTFLRTIPSDPSEGLAIAQVIHHFKWSQVALIIGSDTYSNSLYKSFLIAAAQMKIKITLETYLETIQPDYVQHITEVKNSYMQIIVVFAQQLEAESILKEGYTQGLMSPGFVWIGGDTLAGLTNFTHNALFGNLVITPSATANTSLAQQYALQMASMNLSTPYGSFVYDAVYTYAYAFRNLVMTNSSWNDPHVLLRALLETNFSGVSGEVAFYENGDRIPYAFDINCWQANGQLQLVARIDAEGNFSHIAPIIWSDNSTNTPADYLYLLRYPPSHRIKILFDVLAAVLLGIVLSLIVLLIFGIFRNKIKVTSDNLLVNIPNTIGGVLGFAAIIIVVSGVSKTYCIAAPVLLDLSLLTCGGVLTLGTLREFIEGYKDNAMDKYVSVAAAKIVLYGFWGVIVLLNLCTLIVSFSYEAPSLRLFRREQNFYEEHCNFAQHAILILPITIGAIFAFAVGANFLKMCLNADVAKHHGLIRTRKTEIINSILHSATIVVLVVGAVLIAVTTPTQTQIDITMCVILLVANLSVPCNLIAWYTSSPFNYFYRVPERISYRKDNPFPDRVQPDIQNSFTQHQDQPTPDVPDYSLIFTNNKVDSINALDLNGD